MLFSVYLASSHSDRAQLCFLFSFVFSKCFCPDVEKIRAEYDSSET